MPKNLLLQTKLRCDMLTCLRTGLTNRKALHYFLKVHNVCIYNLKCVLIKITYYLKLDLNDAQLDLTPLGLPDK